MVKLFLWPLIRKPPGVCASTGVEKLKNKFSLENCWNTLAFSSPSILGEGSGAPLNPMRERFFKETIWRASTVPPWVWRVLRADKRSSDQIRCVWWQDGIDSGGWGVGCKAALGTGYTSTSSWARWKRGWVFLLDQMQGYVRSQVWSYLRFHD